MKRALELARSQGRYASPNPKVGAVLVQGGRIVGEGGHQRYGGPHAEILALRRAGTRAKGATLYVTLEPCSHHGKTPPCADAVIRAGVTRVVAAMKDPFPSVAGRGVQKLRKAGIRVEVGLLEKESRALNAPFLFSLAKGRPWVVLKAAITLDGKIATAKGLSKWITGEKSRRKTHELRSQADAILVGSRTARLDDPTLTVRLPGYRRKDGYPLRVVLDGGLRLGLDRKLFRKGPATVVFTSPSAPVFKEKALNRKGVRVFRVPLRQKMLSLKAVLRVLGSLHVRSLLVEGGGEVHASFLREGLADEAVLFISPKIFGGKAPSWVGGKGVENPGMAPYLRDVRIERIGDDLFLRGSF